MKIESIKELSKNIKTVQVTFYDEQLSIDYRELYNRVINTSLDDAEVVLIEHDMNGKKHYHLGCRLLGQSQKNGRHVKTILNNYGIVFRSPEDDNLLANNAIKSINDFSGYISYLIHKTDAARETGKTEYKITDIVSNLSFEQLYNYLEGYTSKNSSKKRIYEELDRRAYEYGYAFKDFDELIVAQPFEVRKNTVIRVIKETYERGVQKRIDENISIVRTCIFIRGQKDIGKTYGANEALIKMGYKNILRPSGGRSGMFDNMKPTTEAIVIDDDKLEDALNICDNRICTVYRRNKNNPVFAGDMVIVTSNLSFGDWMAKGRYNESEQDALRNRFYITEVNKDGKLFCYKPADRGTSEQQEIRYKKYMEFKKYFEAEIQSYRQMDKIDYSHIND